VVFTTFAAHIRFFERRFFEIEELASLGHGCAREEVLSRLSAGLPTSTLVSPVVRQTV
jgi:hypothetical protein